jgi:transposase
MIETATRPLAYEELFANHQALLAENAFLKNELSQLRRMIFGQKRERFVPLTDEQQLSFGLGEAHELAAQNVQAVPPITVTYTRRPKKSTAIKLPSRNPLPSHLRREEIIIEPAEDVSALKKIGEEITEELEYEPGELYVKRYLRPKYARVAPSCVDEKSSTKSAEGVAIAPMPSRPIDKGIAGPGLIAHVMMSKFVDHLPLYRQRQQFSRQGVDISGSTIDGWVAGGCGLIVPLYNAARQIIQRASYLQVDETRIPVLDRAIVGKTHLGFHWVYHEPIAKIVFFDYRPSRSRAGPNDILKNFTGHLQIDGYDGYNEVIARPQVIAVGCFAHARRYFEHALDSDRERAEWMLSKIQELYALERDARQKELSFDQRYELRQKSALPLLAEIKSWLNANLTAVLPKSAIGQAIGYTLGQWVKLEKYASDGRLEIDNNLIENAIRPVAIGRKNYLFAGSHEGARRAAMIYTLVGTAKLHGVEPWHYLKDILGRLPDHPINRVADLLPQHWSPKQS